MDCHSQNPYPRMKSEENIPRLTRVPAFREQQHPFTDCFSSRMALGRSASFGLHAPPHCFKISPRESMSEYSYLGTSPHELGLLPTITATTASMHPCSCIIQQIHHARQSVNTNTMQLRIRHAICVNSCILKSRHAACKLHLPNSRKDVILHHAADSLCGQEML